MLCTDSQADLIATLLIRAGKYSPSDRAAARAVAKGLTKQDANLFIQELNAKRGWDASTAPMSSDQWLVLADLETYVLGRIETPAPDDAPEKTYSWADKRIHNLITHKKRMSAPAEAVSE